MGGKIYDVVCMLEPLCHPLQRLTGVANRLRRRPCFVWGKIYDVVCMSIHTKCGMNAHLYHIVGLSMLDRCCVSMSAAHLKYVLRNLRWLHDRRTPCRVGMAACHCPGSRKTASIQIARTMSSARPLMPWVPVCCSESDPCQSSIIRCDSTAPTSESFSCG